MSLGLRSGSTRTYLSYKRQSTAPKTHYNRRKTSVRQDAFDQSSAETLLDEKLLIRFLITEIRFRILCNNSKSTINSIPMTQSTFSPQKTGTSSQELLLSYH